MSLMVGALPAAVFHAACIADLEVTEWKQLLPDPGFIAFHRMSGPFQVQCTLGVDKRLQPMENRSKRNSVEGIFMPVYRIEPFAPSDSGWQRSLMAPVGCWVLASDEADARALVMLCAYGQRTLEPENPQPELLPWVALASCSLDETKSVPAGIIITDDGQRIDISTLR
jgi:hypothetical protein